MRKLVFFTMGFSAATAIGAYLFRGKWLLLFSVFCMIFGGCCFLLRRRVSFWKQALAIFLGCIAGVLWQFGYTSLYLSPAQQRDGVSVSAVITATDYSYASQYGTICEGELGLDGNRYCVRAYLDDEVQLAPGDALSGTFRLRYTADTQKTSDNYLRSSGTFLVAYPEGEVQIRSSSGDSLRFLGAYLRMKIQGILRTVFPDDTQAFARALLLGDTSELDYETDTHFKLSGIRHIIAVSGLHVSILFSLVYLLSGKRRVMTAILGIPVLVLFAAIAGFTPSVVRACLMQCLMILAMLVNKEYDPPTALAFAVLVMLAVNPAAITSVSLQLSVGCIVGIFMFSNQIRTYLLQRKWLGGGKGKAFGARLGRWFASGVSITLSAMVFTVPLSAAYFGTFTVFSVITNLATLWVVSGIFYGIMASCVFSLLWLPAGRAVAQVISWLIRYVCFVARCIASIPVSAVYTCSIYIVFWLIFSYVLLTLFFLFKRRHPAALTVCICLTLVFSVALSWIEPRLDTYRVTVMDVGQGQCILLQSDGKNYLVDCGGSGDTYSADTAAAQLLSQGIWTLDGVIVTHYDKDHAGGVEYLLTRVDTKALYLPTPDDTTLLDDNLSAKFSDSICFVSEILCILDDNVKITIFAPETQTSRNESSLCVLFQGENCDILITGDRSISGERELLSQAQLPKLDVLIVGHHGAADSAGPDLLRATRPDTAVISVAADNPYGHPSAQVLRRLALFGCRIFRTDMDGTVTVRG